MNISKVEAGWIEEHVQKIDFLSLLTPDQINQLIEIMTPRLLRGNEHIIREGQTGESFFILYSGKASVWIRRGEKRIKIASLNKSDYFGEISLLTGRPATADVLTVAPTKVFFLNSVEFLSLISRNKGLADRIANVIKHRLEMRDQKLQDSENDNLEDIKDVA